MSQAKPRENRVANTNKINPFLDQFSQEKHSPKGGSDRGSNWLYAGDNETNTLTEPSGHEILPFHPTEIPPEGGAGDLRLWRQGE